MTEIIFGTPDISTPIDSLLGLAVVASVALMVWIIWRHR